MVWYICAFPSTGGLYRCKQSYNGCAYTIVGHFNVMARAKNEEKFVMETAALDVISRANR